MRTVLKLASLASITIFIQACQTVPDINSENQVVSEAKPASEVIQTADSTETRKSNITFVNQTGGKKICKKLPVPNSRLQTKNVCLSESGWAAKAEEAREGALDMQQGWNASTSSGLTD